MGGKISDNTDVFENILTKQWRKNPHPKRVRILTRLLTGSFRGEAQQSEFETFQIISEIMIFISGYGEI